jgi:hypothetical protein
MILPIWVREIVDGYDANVQPHSELEIAEVLSKRRAEFGNLSEEDWKGFIAEYTVFFFGEGADGESVWGTYFRPMVEFTQGETVVRNPDIGQLDQDTLAHWAQRAAEVKNPAMKARYADAAWDFAKPIGNIQPDYKWALLAIDGYLEATKQHLYKWENEAVQWLVRALHLARSIANPERIKSVIDAMFAFQKISMEPKLVGIWVFLFDNLYGEKKLISGVQEAEIIDDLEAMLAKVSVVREPNFFDPFGAQAAAERLAKHYKKINDTANVERVLTTYGNAFKTLAADANPMLAMAWLQPVIERYEQAGMKDEGEKLRLLQIEKGQNIASDLKQYSVEIPTTKKDFDDLVEQLLVKNDLAWTLGNLASYFIPNTDSARQMLEEQKSVAPLLSIIPITVVDRTGRAIARVGSVDEASEGRLFQRIAQMIGFYQPFLSYALAAIIDQFKPTASDMLAVLYLSPLFRESQRPLLEAGLSAYLTKDHLKGVHVLVPQIEEMLRTLLALMGIPPQKSVPRHPGITDVKNMNDALGDPRVREVLTEDVWTYLTVLYIERRGLNLRNDLAHGLVPIEGFSQPIADRVLHSLLVLSLLRGTLAEDGSDAPNADGLNQET